MKTKKSIIMKRNKFKKAKKGNLPVQKILQNCINGLIQDLNANNESIRDVKEIQSDRCYIPVKKSFLFFLIFLFGVSAFSENRQHSYRWPQYGIEVLTEEKMDVVEADQDKFRCDGDESNLWINKLNSNVPFQEREKYLTDGISALGLRMVGFVKKEFKDSIMVFSVRVENNKSYGYVFLLNDSLANNNCLYGYMSTGSKPRINMLKLLDFQLFTADIAYKPLAGKSAQTMVNVTDSEHELIKAYSGPDTLIIGKENIRREITGLYEKYSKDISLMMKTYNSLPENLGARKIAVHEDFSRYFSDTLDMKWLFTNSTFAHETYHDVVKWESMMQSIKKTRGNYSNKFYSYYLSDTCTIDVEKLAVPSANLIQKSFPTVYRANNNYSLYIYPSNMTNSTQIDGIYALLNEFGANITESIWYNDILQFYFDQKMNNVLLLGTYMANSTNCFSDCIQLKHYIFHYLLTIKSSAPDLYTKLMSNLNFKRVINLMNQKLNDQITTYNSNKHRISDLLASEYIGFLENENKLILDNDKCWNNTDLTKINNQIEYINSQPDYQSIYAELDCKPCIPISIIKE
jgi:hypothetical protein